LSGHDDPVGGTSDGAVVGWRNAGDNNQEPRRAVRIAEGDRHGGGTRLPLPKDDKLRDHLMHGRTTEVQRIGHGPGSGHVRHAAADFVP